MRTKSGTNMLVRLAFLCTALLISSATSLGAAPLRGTFALQGGSASTEGHLIVTPVGSNPRNLNFDVWLTPRGSNAPIRAYDLDMTKFLHLIVVGDDFRTFYHLHPALRPNGHFALSARLPGPGVYHVYADTVPRGFAQQVFRFDVVVGNARPAAARDLQERTRISRAGPYVLALSGVRLRAGTEQRLLVHVTENGRPATDLHPYLGAAAHAVFLNASDLSYAHVHPLALGATMAEMNGPAMGAMTPAPAGATSAPVMQLHVDLREPGTYKLWLQFRGGSHVYVAPFVLTVR